ncbi:Lipoprotein-releasing system ATP-binding protein LolD [Arthrobacter saudimassiliensis]|uniref:Lipoprotein-releasing system ATP-binding protein LolD n=1 Tax=Arthrobacter saudimassiliensis TaxID=1461584 RepID=A0A078MJ35_9MICC|nr:Lipoprotein-releasing system ATP-binding protein LolD [Arthrobacter saudimassiliensis]
MLEVRNVVKEFQAGEGRITPVNGVSFTLPQGTFGAILGRSGSGKSTLLSILGGLDKATSGDVVVDGVNISTLPEGRLTEYRRTGIGFVFQQYNLVPNLTARENVMLPMEFAGLAREARSSRAEQLLNEVELTPDLHDRKANRLSGGQQQRVSIARALANRPRLILADEPTGNLDEETGERIIDLLGSLCRREGTTILVVTHDQALAARTDVRLRLEKGVITREQPAG